LIEELKKQNEELKNKWIILQLENYKLEDEIELYKNEIIPEAEKTLNETEKKIIDLKIEYESIIGHLNSDRIAFKNDIKDILLFLKQESIIPIYVGEVEKYTEAHLLIIYDYYLQYSKNQVIYKDIKNQYEAIIYPIKITPTECTVVSQYTESYCYNVVHYRTIGMPNDSEFITSIRAPGAVADGLIERFIIEIVKDNGVWKINYTGYGG
jgi:hypothetical protein